MFSTLPHTNFLHCFPPCPIQISYNVFHLAPYKFLTLFSTLPHTNFLHCFPPCPIQISYIVFHLAPYKFLTLFSTLPHTNFLHCFPPCPIQISIFETAIYIPREQMFSWVYSDQLVCPSICVSVFPSVYKILVSVKALAGVSSHVS